MIVDREIWESVFSGFSIRDCTIGFEYGRLGLLLAENVETLENGWMTRFVAIKLANPVNSRFFYMTGGRLKFATMSSSWLPNNEEFINVDTGREVTSYKPKIYKGNETEIPFNGEGYGYADVGEIGSIIQKVVRVGTAVFAIGAPMRIYERIGYEQWREIKEIPIPDELKLGNTHEVISEAMSRTCFHDLAGLSTNLMYAVAEAGVVWMCSNGQWMPLALPTNHDLHTVACAPDGMVYITDMRGCVWRGKDNQWERIVKADHMLPYQDSAWFDGRLWCANDSAGCFVLEGDRMVPAHQAMHKPMPAQVACFAHRLDVAPDGKTMLTAGNQGAAVYDGEHWDVLFDGEPEE